jgi:hypothetical protein
MHHGPSKRYGSCLERLSRTEQLTLYVCASTLALLLGGCAQGGADAESEWTAPDDGATLATGSDAAATGAIYIGPAASAAPTSVAPPSSFQIPEADADDSSADSTTALPFQDPAQEDAGTNLPPPSGDDAAAAPSSDDSGADPADDAPTATVEAPAVFPAELGDLLITEVMFAPSGPSPASEWFEIYNSADSPTLLSGLTIVDGSMHTHTISASPPVVAAASSYVVLVRDRATALANGISPDAIAYEYGTGLASDQGIQLDDGPTGAISLWSGDIELGAVPYGTWDVAAFGQSIELGTLQLVGSDADQEWCFAESPWAPGSDDGTPGAPNDCL